MQIERPDENDFDRRPARAICQFFIDAPPLSSDRRTIGLPAAVNFHVLTSSPRDFRPPPRAQRRKFIKADKTRVSGLPRRVSRRKEKRSFIDVRIRTLDLDLVPSPANVYRQGERGGEALRSQDLTLASALTVSEISIAISYSHLRARALTRAYVSWRAETHSRS